MARIMDIALISEGRGSANLRIYTYTLLLSLFSAQPWLGYGVGTWANLIGLARIGAGPTTTYLYILVEIGLVGIMTFLVFAGAYFWSLGKGFYRSVFPYRSYVAAALISTIGLACTAWFIDIKSILSYFPLFGLYLAIARLSQVDSQEQRVESINNA
jgi:predicted neutral ceramidase superfamily lipid hydrolase